MGSRALKVLSVASECVPLVKTGGLADVVGALPGALAEHGVEMRTLLPGYPAVLEAMSNEKSLAKISDLFGGPACLLAGNVSGLDLLVLDAPHLFNRTGNIYLGKDGSDWHDNVERFAALSKVAADVAGGLTAWQPDVVHCHDWQAGLTPYYMRAANCPAKSILTVHNIAFQGLAPASKRKKLGIAPKDFVRDGVEYWGQVSTLKAGLIFADKITTVSPRYAEELMTPEFGMGLDGVLRYRRDDLSGILNGIDTEVWNPSTDQEIRAYKTARGKSGNKKRLRKEFGLPEASGPLCIVVSRLTEQKGLDLLLEALPSLTGRGGQLALLGSGDPGLEEAFQKAAQNPNVAVRIGYDEALSHRMMAGADVVLVPSRFEPCGLTQLMGLAYGTLPLVALTGGLADTVISANSAALDKGVATGIQFSPVTAEALANAFAQLCELYALEAPFMRMQKNAMAQDVSWAGSAAKYAALYEGLKATK